MDSVADPPYTNIFVIQAIEGWAESVFSPFGHPRWHRIHMCSD